MVELSRELYDEIVVHAQEGYPDEVCGLIANKDGELRAYRVPNVADTPRTRYLMEPRKQYEAMMDMEEQGGELYGIYHSHPSSQAYPSATDRGLAFYPDALYFICTLEDRARPALRAFHIVDDEISEQRITILEESSAAEMPG